MNQQNIKWLSFCECGLAYGGHFINSNATEHEDVLKEQEKIISALNIYEKIKEWKNKTEEGRDFTRYGIGGYSRLTELLKEINI